MAVAVFFRFWQLETIPPGLYPDVAINGNDALQALKSGDYKVFYPENNGREGFFINLIALSFWLFGASIWAIKIVPAVIGALTVLGLYLLTKTIFHYLAREKSEWIALLSAFFIAISFWHVNFSRLGFRAILIPFCLAWSFYFLFKGFRLIGDNIPPRLRHLKIFIFFSLAGLFFGLGFHTYIAFRVAPLILIPVFLFEFFRYWPRFKKLWNEKLSGWRFIKNFYSKDGWWGVDIFFIFLMLAVLPLAIYFFQHPADFMGRASQVSVWEAANPVKELLTSAAKTLGMFNVWGDCNWRHNYACQPILLWPIGLFFLFGFIFSFAEGLRPTNWREKNWPLLTANWTLLIWFFTMLLPAILTTEGLPHSLRSIGAAIPVFIFAGLGAFLAFGTVRKLYRQINFRPLTFYLLIFFVLGTLGYVEFNRYFLDWGHRQEVKSEFAQRYVDIGHYLNSLPADTTKYVMVNKDGVSVPYPDGIPMPAQTVIFITQGKLDVKYLLPDPGSQVKTTGASVFIPLKDDDEIFRQLKQTFPSGYKELRSGFSVFKIGL